MKLSVNAGVVEELAMAVPPDAFFHFEGYFDEGGVYVPVRRVSCLLYTSPSPRDRG